MAAESESTRASLSVTFFLRDIAQPMVEAWNEEFDGYAHVKPSEGDIFRGAPSADAIVSPANSFGFMDGGIDMVYTDHFGWQLQYRLQHLLKNEFDGELPVGQAVIIPTYDAANPPPESPDADDNEGKTIKYLISAPTMRVPETVSNTTHAYLAFRAVIRAVKWHNNSHKSDSADIISSVLCPGLGTAVGRMPYKRCAKQMHVAYDVCVKHEYDAIRQPTSLHEAAMDHSNLCEFGADVTKFGRAAHKGEIFRQRDK
ncbi:uncharacterized protein LOC134187224 [Corticium candelabrum]|uniref:uncharacterized protein LOC134187224 n=1 Tax=Corticium candelabrum TaxID=121492 RepID=UPI002E254974|nr:uncharacterized protein LOC134187224 [Corticium candelabrum]